MDVSLLLVVAVSRIFEKRLPEAIAETKSDAV